MLILLFVITFVLNPRFKNAVLDTNLNCLGCFLEQLGFFVVIIKREDGLVALLVREESLVVLLVRKEGLVALLVREEGLVASLVREESLVVLLVREKRV